MRASYRRIMVCGAIVLPAVSQAPPAWACSLRSRPQALSVNQLRQKAIQGFQSGSMVGVAIAKSINGTLTLSILRSYHPSLKTGVRYRRKNVFVVPCGGGLEVNETRLVWVDPNPEAWPGVVTREQAQALLDEGLITDRSILNYLP